MMIPTLAAAALFSTQCTATAIYKEAANQRIETQRLVASVVNNHAKALAKPRTPLLDTCSAIKTKGKFSWYNKTYDIWRPREFYKGNTNNLQSPPHSRNKTNQQDLKAYQQALAIAADSLAYPNKSIYNTPYVYFNHVRLGKRFPTATRARISGDLIFY